MSMECEERVIEVAGRKAMRFSITPELVAALLLECRVIERGGKSYRVTPSIPSDARGLRFGLDELTGNLSVVVEHDSFEPVRHGDRIPEVMVGYTMDEVEP